MTRVRRIGLLGGSFDPPHLAHLALGRVAMHALALDELRWLPAGAPWQKADRLMAPPQHRAAMLAALVGDEPGCQVIDPRELQRAGATYTIDSVRELQAEQPDAAWFLVLGQDQYARFDTWRDWRDLLQRLTLAVAGRAGQAPKAPAALSALPHRVKILNLPPLHTVLLRLNGTLNFPYAANLEEGNKALANYLREHIAEPRMARLELHSLNNRVDTTEFALPDAAA